MLLYIVLITVNQIGEKKSVGAPGILFILCLVNKEIRAELDKSKFTEHSL